MAQAGQFGSYYAQVVDRLFHALEWRFNDIKDKPGMAREAEILAKLLDVVLADQIVHELPLHSVEAVLKEFQKIRNDSFSPNKYKAILARMEIDVKHVEGYTPCLFGNVTLETRFHA